MLDRFFGISDAHSTVHREIRAGMTTFLTMAYILFLNPSILGQAISLPNGDAGPQLLTATALAAAFGSLVMGLAARRPYALAPGMGLNAYFAFSVVLGMGIPWQTALGAVFLSGLAFIVISFSGLRHLLIAAIPKSLKLAISAGIGAFLAMIGFVNAKLVTDHPVTLVSMGDWMKPETLIAMAGLILVAALLVLSVRGALFLAIVGTSVLAIATGAPVFDGASFGGFTQGLLHLPAWPSDLFLAMDLAGALEMGALSICFTFLIVDFFDTTGTLVALSHKAGFAADLDKPAGPTSKTMRFAFGTDALATCFGALFGTSSTTTYIESAAGIEEGGKTGLTAVTVALLFLASLFLWPLASAVPAAATAPALIAIGAMMFFNVTHIEWKDPAESLPALLTILGMPMTYSITNGITLGLVSYSLIHLFTGRAARVPILCHFLSGLLLARMLWLGAA
ncbi:NCS2 family permease [Sulfidibacter corallicola]|uniref:NCS2 family permease n=1 Tax=Sulfidibacter corallicola TaxID=2818388 RepID=A0A8A4TVD9_SULCO|nr:NCS2 family permease [Sulfidibacter corallicola]QTD53138.1 NCS2 family permease [Sulfidibacter corallicola]